MAKNGDSRWGHMRPGRRSADPFSKLVSPLGEDAAETPVYSPSREVKGAKGQPRRQLSEPEERRGDRDVGQTNYRRDERRGG